MSHCLTMKLNIYYISVYKENKELTIHFAKINSVKYPGNGLPPIIGNSN